MDNHIKCGAPHFTRNAEFNFMRTEGGKGLTKAL
jgi:hypothetical protein